VRCGELETIGLVASYEGTIIGALYSSSMGGHTEHNEWIHAPATIAERT
jgi:hypothetical protein